MPDSNLGRTIAKNIKRMLYEKHLTSADMVRDLGIKQTTISGWLNEYKIPRGNTIDMLCNYLGCTSAELIGESGEMPYYINDETARIAQEAYDNPELRMLFDASRDSRPEDIRLAIEMLKRFKETNRDG